MKERDDAERATKIAPTRFIWIPGARPVKAPAKMPSAMKINTSRNILPKKLGHSKILL